MQTKERKTKEKLLIGVSLLTEQSRTFSGHCPYGGTPCFSFLFTISEWEYLRGFKEDSKNNYVMQGQSTRVSSCSDELRKRRPFGSSDYDQRSMIQISDWNSKPTGMKHSRKCIQCIQFTVIFVYPHLLEGEE